MAQESDSRGLDKVIVRLPDGMRDTLRDAAAENNRSMNAEIVARLEEYPRILELQKMALVSDAKIEQLEKQLENAREQNVFLTKVISDNHRDHMAKASEDENFSLLEGLERLMKDQKDDQKLIFKEQQSLIEQQSGVIDKLQKTNKMVANLLAKFDENLSKAAKGDSEALNYLLQGYKEEE